MTIHLSKTKGDDSKLSVRALLAAAYTLILMSPARADDWPQWGGNDPGRNLYSPEKGLPRTFHPGTVKPGTDEIDLGTTKNVKWVAKLGSQSWGNCTVAGGKVFVGTNNNSPRDPRHQGDRSILMCFDERTGQFLWQLVVPKLSTQVQDWGGLGLVTSAAIEGNRVYVVTPRCEVLCLTTEGLGRGNVGPFKDEGQYMAGPDKPKIEPSPKDADIVWRYDMMEELGVFPHAPRFLSGSSLLLAGDLLYVCTGNGVDQGHKNVPSPHLPSLIALSKKTGLLVAEDDAAIGPRIFHGQWSSPSYGKVNNRPLVFFGGGDGVCYAFDAHPVKGEVKGEETGLLKKVWWYDCNPPRVQNETRQTTRLLADRGPQ